MARTAFCIDPVPLSSTELAPLFDDLLAMGVVTALVAGRLPIALALPVLTLPVEIALTAFATQSVGRTLALVKGLLREFASAESADLHRRRIIPYRGDTIPRNAYFKGHGDQVMARMIREYGKKKGKTVFYATAQKRGQTPRKQKA